MTLIEAKVCFFLLSYRFQSISFNQSIYLFYLLKPYSYRGPLKRVLHPWPILWLFMHFSQDLQHIGDKQDMFRIVNIPRNLITASEFH